MLEFIDKIEHSLKKLGQARSSACSNNTKYFTEKRSNVRVQHIHMRVKHLLKTHKRLNK